MDRPTAVFRVSTGGRTEEPGRSADQPETDAPAGGKPSAEEPAAGRSASDEPSAEKPAARADEATADESGTERPERAEDESVDRPTAVFRVRPRAAADDAPASKAARAAVAGEGGKAARTGKTAEGGEAAKAGKNAEGGEAAKAGKAAKAGETAEGGEAAKAGKAAKAGETAEGGEAAEVGEGQEASASAASRGGADGEASTGAKGASTGAPSKAAPAEAAGDPRAGGTPVDRPTSRFVPLRPPEESAGDRPTVPRPASPRSARDTPGGSDATGPRETAEGLGEGERTARQPVPDQDPLQLLAQLTNKPAPPPTPLRTVLRRIKIWSPLVVLLLIVFAVAQLLRPLPEPGLRLTVQESFTFDGQRPNMPWPTQGQAVVEVAGLGSLGSYGEAEPVPIASVAKVMTAYVVLRDHPVRKGSDGAVLTVDRQAAEDVAKGADGESVVEVAEGDKITQKEALQAILIASANNIARMLARWDAGSEQAFVKKMNATAKKLGMTNTTYTDPSGLRADTRSTAADQVKLATKAMADPLFREIVRQPFYEDSRGERHNNWNRLIPYHGVVGIKTGTTTVAGGNLLFAAEKEVNGTTQLIVGAVLSQQSSTSILDEVLARSKDLVLAAGDALVSRTLFQKGEVVGVVDDGLGNETPVVATRDVAAVGWPGLEVELRLDDEGEGVPGAAEADTTVGVITVGDGPGQVKVPVALQKEKTEPGIGDRLLRIL